MKQDPLRALIARRRWLAALAGAGLAPSLLAQRAYPERVIRTIVPNAPGSSVDTIGRALALELAKVLGQALVIDNRAGAAGAIGVEAARMAPPDGYTVLIGSSSAISVAPLLQKAVTYQPLRDFELVSLVALLPNVLVCNPGLPVQNVRELIEYGKAKNGDLRMASAGIGSVSHLAGAAFAAAAGFKSLHVPYKGGSQGVASVVSGETDWELTPAPAAMGQVAARRLRLLGHSMAASTQPLGSTPSIANELPGFEFASWIGLMAPRGLAPGVVDTLGKAVAASVQRPEVQKAFEIHGAVAHASSPEEFRAWLVRDIEANRKAIAAAGLQPE